jgi:histidinol dehydrogenase
MPESGFTVRRLRDLPSDDIRRRLDRSAAAIFNDQMRAYARRVLDDVSRDGDIAVASYTRQWDQVSLAPPEFLVRREETAAAHRAIDPVLRGALETSIAMARRYNEWLHPAARAVEELLPGITVGLQYRACRSAGLYVPSGKGTFPSMLITMGTPAVVAGVERVAVVVPPRGDGTVDPAILVAGDLLGISAIYRCNGAAGVAALAVGTPTIARTDVIVGPGNPVIAAVQQAAAAYGARPLVTLGPTESIVLADASADPVRLVIDLLNEAEHGDDSAVMLLATDAEMAERVASLLPTYLNRLPEPRRGYARRAIEEHGGLFVTDDLDEAIDWINRYGPEHLQLAVRDPLGVASRVNHAGEILAGQFTPFSAANYAIGVPAALPTSGAAFAASGVTVLTFLKAVSIASLTAEGLRTVAPVAIRLGQHEGFPAHIQAITEREVLLR